MASKPTASLLALFTAEDLLTADDRRVVAIETEEERRREYRRKRWQAEIAYHLAAARGAGRSLAWLNHAEDHDIEESRHDAAVVALVGAVSAFVRVPASTKAQLTDKAAMVRKWARGSAGSYAGVACWREREPGWQEALTAEAERMGGKAVRGAK